MWIFLITLIGLAVWSFKSNLSLIPLLGLICFVYDGRIKRLELDLFWNLAFIRFSNLLWL
jgi:hypothetical protein